MTNEELLKSISDMLKKHEDYLSDNPDVFLGIQERFLDAIGYGDSESLEKAEDDEGKPKVSRSGYSDWQPKDKYDENHQADIDKYMEMGLSHREAERMAGAHDHEGMDFGQSMENNKTNPSVPSDLLHDLVLRDAGLKFKQDIESTDDIDVKQSPQKFAGREHIKAHDEAYADYDKDYKAFLNELDEQDLHPLEYDEAVSNWQKEWHEKNPEAKEKMAGSAEAGKIFDEAKQTREESIEERKKEIAFGSAPSDMDMQTAAQSVGTKGERGYEASTFKDPASIMQEQSPEYFDNVRRDFEEKLNQNPEAKERHAAMPSRDRQPKPLPVRTLSPEEIKAQYGDKYKIKGDE